MKLYWQKEKLVKRGLVLAIFSLIVLSGTFANAQDWPMRMYDIRRGGITPESLQLPLTESWTYAGRLPNPAWSESPSPGLKARQNFDSCYDVAAAGGNVYFGSSRSGAVTCLNSSTGENIWKIFTDGPVRFAPSVANSKVYVGSDDGYAYCLNADDGSVVWKIRAGPSDRKIWGNQHMISVWPIRSSILVDGSDAFWTAGLFKEDGMYICKRSAVDGTGGWTVAAEKSPQGYILASPTQLFVPTGRTYPLVYSRTTGSFVGYVRHLNDYAYRDGGCWSLLTPDLTEVWSGPTINKTLQQFSASSRTLIAVVDGANYLIADSTYAYYNTDSKIFKINRSDRSLVWCINRTYPYSLIKANGTLFAGGDGAIAGFNSNGDLIWQSPVDGKAYGLAVANGKLYVSTDKGRIHCFTE